MSYFQGYNPYPEGETNPSFQYVNLSMNNQGLENQSPMPALASVSLTTPLVNDTGDYFLAVSKLTISGQNNPLIIPLAQLNQPNPNVLRYKFCMGYNGVLTGDVNVLFVPNNLSPIPQPPTIIQDLSSTYYYIYEYEDLLEMFNTALNTALVDLIGSTTLPEDIPPPKFSFNAITGISLTASTQYFRQSYGTTPDTDYIQIYCNQYVYPLLLGLSMMQLALVAPNQYCKYSIKMDPNMSNIVNNNYVISQQSLDELCYWSSIYQYQLLTTMNKIGRAHV